MGEVSSSSAYSSAYNSSMCSSFYSRCIKRPLDIVVSLCLIVLLSPILLLTSLLVCIHLGRPIIFKQQRPGLHEKPFEIYKFRTMTASGVDTSKTINPVPDAQRLTRFGKLLRSTSLDELPQLFNILKGDMSFVGPRPLMLKYLPYYTDEERLRHSVKPGLTGLAQVNGRNFVTWDKRLKLDVQYARKVTFLLDAMIVLLTVKRVAQRKDVAANPQIMKSLDKERAGF
jgi:lipopolysaccharide/colanic/teichoic acid biosynthesis glycosyltransferase